MNSCNSFSWSQNNIHLCHLQYLCLKHCSFISFLKWPLPHIYLSWPSIFFLCPFCCPGVRYARLPHFSLCLSSACDKLVSGMKITICSDFCTCCCWQPSVKNRKQDKLTVQYSFHCWTEVYRQIMAVCVLRWDFLIGWKVEKSD